MSTCKFDNIFINGSVLEIFEPFTNNTRILCVSRTRIVNHIIKQYIGILTFNMSRLRLPRTERLIKNKKLSQTIGCDNNRSIVRSKYVLIKNSNLLGQSTNILGSTIYAFQNI